MKSNDEMDKAEIIAELEVNPGRFRRAINALVSQPWAIQPEMLDLMVEIVDERAAGLRRNFPVKENNETQVVDGVAIIPIEGVLMNRANSLQRISGATSPQAIASDFENAMRNKDVFAVVLDINSPGGQVAGVAEAADRIWNAKQNNPRPVIAYGEGLIASGAYWLASQADEIIVTPTTMVGSIGVVTKIIDTTRKEKNAGEDSIVIKTGAKKALGVGPITEEQISDIKAVAEEFFAMFVESVERGRGKKLTNDILSGKLYTAKQAMSNGILVDGIGTMTDVLGRLKKSQKSS